MPRHGALGPLLPIVVQNSMLYRDGLWRTGERMIPRLLSQTWKTQALPARAQVLLADWARLNPGLTLRLYDDAGARAVVADVASERLALYDALGHGVMRADLFRWAVLLRDGGIYADIDMQALRPLPEALFSTPCLLSEEAHLGRLRQLELGYPRPVQIANCIMAGRAGHPFFRAALETGFALAEAQPSPPRDRIEDLTGPRMVTRLLQGQVWPEVMIAPQIQFMAPLEYPTRGPVGRHIVTRHEAQGSWKGGGAGPSLWRRWVERNRPVNPFRAPVWRPAADYAGSPA